MQTAKFLRFFGFWLLLAVGLAQAQVRPTLTCSSDGRIFNTAYNNVLAGPPKSSGLDNVWEVGTTYGVAQPANWTSAAVVTTNPGWSLFAGFTASKWIANNTNQTAGGGHAGDVDLWYRYVFTMDPAVIPSTFRLAMAFYADNSVSQILVNGVSQVVPGVPDPDPYQSVHFNTAAQQLAANLTQNWQTGTNTLLVRISSGAPALGFLANNSVTALCQTKVTVSKTTLGGAGGPFTIGGGPANPNGLVNQNITTAVAGTPVSGATQTLTTSGAVTDIQENTLAAGYTLSAINCSGLGSTGTATTNLTNSAVSGVPARSVRLDAAATAAGSNISCNFVNQRNTTTLTVSKTTIGGVGGPFIIAGTGANANGFASQSITTTVAGTPVSGATQTLTAVGAVTDIQEGVPAAGFGLSAITCTGLGAGGSATANVTNSIDANGIPARSVRLNAAATAAGSSISCAFVNRTSTIQLTKALSGDRLAVYDQFSVAIRTGGVAGTVVSSTTNATTTGTLSTVNAGSGTTGTYSATAGTAYTLTEASAAGTNLANYSAALTCTDAAGLQTGLPSGAAFNPSTGFTVTPVAGAALNCTITNTRILVPPAAPPQISCTSDGNIFNTAYNGATAKASGLDNVWERGATFGVAQPASWTLATVVSNAPGAWTANGAFPASKFVAHQADGDHNVLGEVDLWYRYVFNMNSNVVLSSFRLAMDFYADNSVAGIYVNGVLQTVAGVPVADPYNFLGYRTENPRSAVLASNWQSGLNTILVRVSTGPGYLGFMAKNTVSALCQSQVRLQKAIGGLGRLATADQFTVDIRTGGVAGTVVNSTTNSTTLGGGATVTAGSGDTGVFSSTAGTTYTLNEAMAAGSASALTNYTRTLTCTNVGGGSTNVTGFTSLPLTYSAASGDNVVCTVTNTPLSAGITGRVFLDNGVAGGTANDGLINGGEAGLAGITVRLTNCAATVYASGTTDGTGAYNLAVPTGTATGAALCVEQTNQGMRTSTGASVAGTALPSGAATTVAATSYTYTRTGTPDRIAFTWNGTGHSGLNFGDVDASAFAAIGTKAGQPGTTVSYAHTFTAGTGGSVTFAISAAVPAPVLGGWSEKIFADPGCTGTLQAGATQLFPPVAAATSVVFGQNVCVIMQEFIPATATTGYQNDVTVQANFSYSNATPALPTASYTLHDITTVGTSVLELRKEVRNVTQGVLTFGINNQAKSGETLEYRIRYSNNAATFINNLQVSDTTPVYTSFVSTNTGTTPATLTACTKNTPANPLPAAAVNCTAPQPVGGTGTVTWKFVGTLNPGDAGDVLFQVKVD